MVQDKIKYQRKPLIHKGKWYSITQDRKQKWQFESCTAHHLKTLKPFWFQGFSFGQQREPTALLGGYKSLWRGREQKRKSLQVRVSEKFADQHLQKRGD